MSEDNPGGYGVLVHSGRVNFRDCPVLACSGRRDVRAQVDFPSGQRRVVTGCEQHISLLVARAVMRVVAPRGREAVVAHIDSQDATRRTRPFLRRVISSSNRQVPTR